MQKIISNKTDSVFWIKDCEILRNTFIYVCTSIYREGKLEMHMPQAAIEGGGCNKSAVARNLERQSILPPTLYRRSFFSTPLGLFCKPRTSI